MALDISYLPLAYLFTSPGPILVKLGPLTIRWYGLLIASAVLIGVTLSQYLAKRRHVNPDLLSDLSIWLVIGAIPAARIYYVLFQWQEYSQRPWDIFAIWKGGIAIHGAIIGGLIVAILFAKFKKVSFWQLADLVAPSLILGQAIGRWGNFFNSEAFGKPTNLPWKLYIPREITLSDGSNIYPRPPEFIDESFFHPTFLYESLWNVMIFSLLMILFFRGLQGKLPLKTGTIFLVYLVGYSLGRFWIEGLRLDSLMLGPLRIAQIVSLVEIAIGLTGLWWLYIRKRPLPDVVSTQNEEEIREMRR